MGERPPGESDRIASDVTEAGRVRPSPPTVVALATEVLLEPRLPDRLVVGYPLGGHG